MLDNGYRHRRSMSVEQAPLPSPSDTPYQTPHLSGSRISSFGSPTSTPLTTPPFTNGFANHNHGNQTGDVQYDPDQFTPSIHASLVSKILSLQQELTSKREYIGDVEADLASARAEIETYQGNLKRVGNEKRALKRQVQLYEENAVSAVEVLTAERDQAKDANTELHKTIEILQQKSRAFAEDSARQKSMLEQERVSAASEKRSLERRVELAETRLHAMIEDVAASQQPSVENSEVRDVNSRPPSALQNRSLAGSPEFKRHLSRRHKQSIDSLYEATKPSLADELDFDNQEAQSDEEPAAPTPPRRSESRPSKVLGMVSTFEQKRDSIDESITHGAPTYKPSGQVSRGRSSLELGTSNRPSTPQRQSSSTTQEEITRHQAKEPKFELSQERELQALPRLPRSRAKSELVPMLLRPEEQNQYLTFLSSHESLKQKIEKLEAVQQEKAAVPVVVYSVAATQTDAKDTNYVDRGSSAESVPLSLRSPPKPTRAPPPVPNAVPAITVHPPDSKSAKPKLMRSRLSEATRYKNVGVQTNNSTVSAAVQTEAIRVDKRPVRLPSHLLPAALDKVEPSKGTSGPITNLATGGKTSRNDFRTDVESGTDRVNSERSKAESSKAGVPVTKLVLNSPPLGTLTEGDQTNFERAKSNYERDHNPSPTLPPLEEGPDEFTSESDGFNSSSSRHKAVQGTHNASNGLESPSNELADIEEIDDMYASDTEFGSHAPIRRPSHGRSRQAGKRPEPHLRGPPGNSAHFNARRSIDSKGRRSSEHTRRGSRLSTSSDVRSQFGGPRSSLTREGSLRSRSPSLGSVASSGHRSKASGPRPPFPPFEIPKRESSREIYGKIRIQRRNQSPNGSRRSGRSSPTKGGKGKQRLQKPVAPKILRKSQSEAAIGPNSAGEDQSGLPPLPHARLIGKPVQSSFSAGNSVRNFSREEPRPSVNTHRQSALLPTGGASVGSTVQYDFVEAMTQTGIGEWMYKYRRGRRSFGMSSTSVDTNRTSDVRQKRWLWLSPHEKTVMWSNKQPTSASALMGKPGRKLSIKSALDIPDKNAPPKEARSIGIFNRSIMILTTDGALKITATSKERHYLWLTALSFLSHSSPRSMQSVLKLQPPPSLSEHPASSNSSGRSRASSFRNPLKSNKSKVSSQHTSGVVTPVTAQNSEANIRHQQQQLAQQKPPLPDSAYAPAIPRVPHTRKRSLTGPSRGRSGGMMNALNVYPTPANSYGPGTIPPAPSNSSVRMPSASASSRRSMATREEESVVAENGSVAPRKFRGSVDPSPRMSEAGADFGGNSQFFDAGVMRMTAFSGPSSRNGEKDASGHVRQESSGDFIGPPDIGRHRRMAPINQNAFKNF